MDYDDTHIAGDFFLQPTSTETASTRPQTIYERVRRFLPQETMIHIQHCLLRVPLILMYDYLFTEHFTSLTESFYRYSIKIFDRYHSSTFQPIKLFLNHRSFETLLHLNLFLCLPIIGLMLLVFLLLCSDRHLVIFYSYTISLLVIFFDYQMTALLENSTASSFNMYILQFILSSIYLQMLNLRPRVASYRIQTSLCHFAPFALILTQYFVPFSMKYTVLRLYYLLWTSVHVFELFRYHSQTVIDLVRDRFLHELYPIHQNLGFQTLLDYVQSNANILTLLKIFWITKIVILPLGIRSLYRNPYLNNITVSTTSSTEGLNNVADVDTNVDLLSSSKSPDSYEETFLKTIYFTCLFYGTETILTLISLACLVSHVMKNVSHRLFRFLEVWTEDVEQIGTLVGVMFFLLLFQSNITRLDLDRRHVPLLKAFSLLLIALLHFLHTILEPQLLKVAMQTMTTRMAFYNMSESNNEPDQNTTNEQDENQEHSHSSQDLPSIVHSFHHRHVYTCFGILCILLVYILLLWRLTTFSTWLLAVTAFSLELIIRILASLAQFAVYVLDAHNRLPNIDSFDEYLFRIKAVTSCFEFVLGVFLLFNGLYIFMFESRGALRALMLGIHAYTNILKNLRRGWKIFCNRKSAWMNVNQLPLATTNQIEDYNDICPICHNALIVGVTCITPCSHLFHKKCLQKAFYTTQNCALCSRPIIVENKEHQS